MEWRTETEDLRATTLAFILGIRGDYTGKNAARPIVDGSTPAPGYAAHNVAYQPKIMPGMPGTERFQQLCSIEYLQMYFAQVLSNKTIDLSQANLADLIEGLDDSSKTTGPIGAYRAAKKYADGLNLVGAGNPSLRNGDNTTLLNGEDIALMSGLAGSEAAVADPSFQGIFARDFGPFLKGKGTATRIVSCTKDNVQDVWNKGAALVDQKTAQPFSMSRNAGDDLAFAVLDALLTKEGLTDWRPDGIVLSKGVNDPSDKFSDEYLEARDGQLYNIRVQGPAVGTNWTGDRSLETLPLDKVFVVLIADVWFDDNAGGPSAEAAAQKPASMVADPDGPAGTMISEYELIRRTALRNGGVPMDEAQFKADQEAAYMGNLNEKTVLCNFRVQVSTSSQMVNHSNFSSKGNANATQKGFKRPRLEGMSRMGLKLCPKFGEYVVGGWQIGQVLDTSASRAVMPQGQLMGVRTAPNTSALNINVQISWWTADRLARAFNNPEGTVVTRFNANQRVLPKAPVNLQASKKVWGVA